MLLERRKTDEKEAEKGPFDPGCHTACIFYLLSALFSTAFAGVKSIFQAIAAHQQTHMDSFLDVTGLLLLVTILFGRHFCGYACAFGSPGDAMYELTVFIKQKVFHKKGRHGYPEKAVRILQKGEVYTSGISSAFHPDRMVCIPSGDEPVGCLFHVDSKKTSKCFL